MTFSEQLHDIANKGLTPTVTCTVCGRSGYFFEGLVSEVEKIYNRPCDKCGGKNKFHGTDVDP